MTEHFSLQEPLDGVQSIQAYRTADGMMFDSLDEARAYMSRTQAKIKAQAYVDGRGKDGRSASIAFNIVEDFLLWQDEVSG